MTMLPDFIFNVLRALRNGYVDHVCIPVSSVLTHGVVYPTHSLVSWRHVTSIRNKINPSYLFQLSHNLTYPAWLNGRNTVARSRSFPEVQQLIPEDLFYTIPCESFYQFADGREQTNSSSDKRSLTGCYKTSLGLQPKRNKSPSTAPLLTFISVGKHANDVLKTFMDEVVTSFEKNQQITVS